MAVSFEDNRLTIDGSTVELEKPIKNLIERRDQVIVVFRYGAYDEDDLSGDRNVVAVGRNGAMLWRVAPSGSIASGGPGRTSQFVGVDIENRDGEEVIVVYDGMGACYDLDPETGKLSNPVLTK